MTGRLLAAIAALAMCVCLPHAHAADEAVILRNGEVIGGKVISLSPTELVLEISRAGQREQVKVRVEDISAGSLYTLKAARIPDGDAAAHMSLAEWCMTVDLAYFAGQEFAKAKQLDGTLAAKADEGMRKAKLARGRRFYTRAVDAMQAKRYSEARRLFGIVVKHYPTPFGGPAKKALAFVDQQLAAKRAGAGAGRPVQGGQGAGKGQGGQAPPAGPPASRIDARILATLDRVSRQIKGTAQAGYYAKTDSRARRHWEDASKLIDQSLEYLERHRRAGKVDGKTHARLRQPFLDQGADLGLQLAIVALRRDNEYAAQRWLARVLLLDPDNERAQELRTYIVTEFRDRNRRRKGKPWLR